MRPSSIRIHAAGPFGYDVLPTDLQANRLFNLELAALKDLDNDSSLAELAQFQLVELPIELLGRYVVKDLAQYLEEGEVEATDDLDRTLELIRLLQKNAPLPPVVVVVLEDGRVELLDGYHRVTAHHHAGRTAILAYEALL